MFALNFKWIANLQETICNSTPNVYHTGVVSSIAQVLPETLPIHLIEVVKSWIENTEVEYRVVKIFICFIVIHVNAINVHCENTHIEKVH